MLANVKNEWKSGEPRESLAPNQTGTPDNPDIRESRVRKYYEDNLIPTGKGLAETLAPHESGFWHQSAILLHRMESEPERSEGRTGGHRQD